MSESLQNFLPILYPSLNEKLVTLDELLQIESISKILPNISAVSGAGFECHLTNESINSDMSIAFSKSNRHLVLDSFHSLPHLADRSDLWKKVYKLIEKWTTKNSLVYENIEDIWLEFDIDDIASGMPEPSVFFSPHPQNLSFTESTTNFAKYEWIVKEVLELLINKSISNATKDCLIKCFNLLPEGGTIFQVGVMLPRLSESKAIRLCIQGIEISKVIKYLNSIGWFDPTEKLTSILNELMILTDFVAINISVESNVHPKIGIECYINEQANSASKWKTFLNFILRKNLCTIDEIAGLMEWTGYVEEKSCPEIWPESLSKTAKFIHPNFRSAAIRVISHIKIVYQPMMPSQAKAYLWFGHRWIKQNGLLQQ
jgi:hypothetical protein